MKVRQTIEFRGFENGYTYITEYSDDIIDIGKIDDNFDWNLFVADSDCNSGDTEIIVKWFNIDANIMIDDPIKVHKTMCYCQLHVDVY